jgi:hypothetical protein
MSDLISYAPKLVRQPEGFRRYELFPDQASNYLYGIWINMFYSRSGGRISGGGL